MGSEYEIEEFLGVIRQVLMLVLICVVCLFTLEVENRGESVSLEENCLRINNLGLIMYHLFAFPYIYEE